MGTECGYFSALIGVSIAPEPVLFTQITFDAYSKNHSLKYK